MDKKITIRLTALLVLIILFVGGGLLWWNDALSPADPNNTSTQMFAISQGENIRGIATRLKAEGLIKDQIGFFLQIKLMGLDEKIQAGDFRLSPSMDVKTIAEELTHGSIDVWVTILEGWRVEEIALKLAQTHDIPEAEFKKYAQEGYMFPDTYLLPKEASAAGVARVLRSTFDTKVTSDIRQAIEGQGLTFEEGIILASIVEREGLTDEDRPIIAGILLSRLRDNHPLQADATLQYALGYQTQEKDWWKKTLYNEDKEVNSPHNTYQNRGLPPAPISNPGMSAIQAVAYPVETDYYYYLHDEQGGVHYGRTLEEHNENVANFLN